MDTSELFERLCVPDASRPGARVVARADLLKSLEECGLSRDDARLAQIMHHLSADDTFVSMSEAEFETVVGPSAILIGKALTGRLVIPDFPGFVKEVANIFEKARANTSGAVASYIPELAMVNPEFYGASVCTIDGQLASMGDDTVAFCVQSCCKPILYMMALEAHGTEMTHRFVGREPSGGRFNKLELKTASAAPPEDSSRKKSLHRVRSMRGSVVLPPIAMLPQPREVPHNPLINSGAILCSNLCLMHHIASNSTTYAASAMRHALSVWSRLTLGNVSINMSVFHSEKTTADRNKCLTYMMKESLAIPPAIPADDTLDFYFQMCSVETTVRDMSVLAATLANGGVHPMSGKRIFDALTVRNCLSLMTSCGMYDFSGEWAFNIGLPAKSGVGGCVFVVVPNVCGFAVWSPRLDPVGNSARAVQFFKDLTKRFSFHALDNLQGVPETRNAINPVHDPHSSSAVSTMSLIFAAHRGELATVKSLVASGCSVNSADYDSRYPLHLAAADNHLPVVKYLLGRGADVNAADRWGHTAVDEAARGGHSAVIEYLRAAGGLTGDELKARRTPKTK